VAEREFNVQVMETRAQWGSGLHSRLSLDDDGLSLFVNPVFDSWLVSEEWGGVVADMVVDECGQPYWAALEPPAKDDGGRAWHLSRRNPTTGEVERVLRFAGCAIVEPKKLWLTPDYLWLFDVSADRVVAMSRDNYQVVYEFAAAGLFDADLDGRGFLYTLAEGEGGRAEICRHSIPPFRAGRKECRAKETRKRPKAVAPVPGGGKECFTLKCWREPEALAVGRGGVLYVLDTALGRIISFDPETEEELLLGAPKEKLLKGFKPSVMEIDGRGVIFLASSAEPGAPSALHMFDEDGSYLGEVELPSSVKSVGGVGFDHNGGVYLATDRGLARFTLSRNPVGQAGIFYSKTLDNGNAESLWHRVALQGSIPGKTGVEVFYHASDDEGLRAAYEQALSGPGSVEERAARIEALMSKNWVHPETFIAAASPDLILNPNKGRFLWLKLRLVTFDEKSRPSIRSARVYYPRLSYLRYLPPAYREDAVSAAFLERFLSIFETVFEGLDAEIDQLFRHFDPRLAPKEFLPWLASWINVSLDEDLPEERVRRLVSRAPYLYGRKGTPEALVEFLEIYTGAPVVLTEHARAYKPQVLGGPDFRLGHGTLLLGSGPAGMRVGDTTVVGYAAIRDRVADPDEPFLSLARRFTVGVGLSVEEFQRREGTLRRIVEEQKPAHTACAIRSTAGRQGVGAAVLGVGAKVGGALPYRVGLTPLGGGSATARGPRASRLERGAGVGGGGRL